MMSEEFTGKIENWSLVFMYCGDPYQPPEVGHQVVQGTFHDHARLHGPCHTSRFLGTEVLPDGSQVALTESGSRYLLGKMSPEYKEYLRDLANEAESTNNDKGDK